MSKNFEELQHNIDIILSQQIRQRNAWSMLFSSTSDAFKFRITLSFFGHEELMHIKVPVHKRRHGTNRTLGNVTDSIHPRCIMLMKSMPMNCGTFMEHLVVDNNFHLKNER